MALLNRFIEIDVMTQAASLSFYALLSLAPLLVLLLWLTASLYPPAQEALVAQVGQLIGGSSATVAQTVIDNATAQPGIGTMAGTWSTLLLFVGATAVFAQLQNALNLIFHTDRQRLAGILAWLKKRVFSFGVVLALGFLLLVSMIATTALQVAFARLPSVLPAVGYVTTLLVYVLAFAFLYRYLPDRLVSWRQAILGGIITAALFALGRYAIGLYISEAAPGSAYGSMGALVVLLVWMYYASVVFFVGALITAVIDERTRARYKLDAAGIDPANVPPPHRPAPET
ncbi:YihY/virulence factor BrkB family protein [Stenotrophomonas sp. HITSZ_GD]|uniref:YihY/virulence factor BrkB family protein n=1 Tax=Stenotrophomonas sp. HITSZ_GD TaxID=3037248 RepID=UPI0031F31E6D